MKSASEGRVVAKFGGSSLADRQQLAKVLGIIHGDERIRYVVVSAPGKRHAEDEKLTDVLLAWQRRAAAGEDTKAPKNAFLERFIEIADELQAPDFRWKLGRVVAEIDQRLRAGASQDYAASRGEHLMAQLLAELLGWKFVDATELIFLNGDAQCHWELTNDTIRQKVRDLPDDVPGVVIPGFYGSDLSRSGACKIRVLPRGGSDVTAAIIAAGVGATEYQNWTDADGILSAHPGIVDHPLPIDVMDYGEAGEASNLGMNALHPWALHPVEQAGIPTRVHNTNKPTHPGTLILHKSEVDVHPRPVLCVAGRRGYALIKVKKTLMNDEVGVVRKMLSVLEGYGYPMESIPGGVGRVTIIVDTEKVPPHVLQGLAMEMRVACGADWVEIVDDVAQISVIGRKMHHSVGIASKVLAALSVAGVNIRTINQDDSEINITIGVDSSDLEKGIKAIYARCIAPQPAPPPPGPGKEWPFGAR